MTNPYVALTVNEEEENEEDTFKNRGEEESGQIWGYYFTDILHTAYYGLSCWLPCVNAQGGGESAWILPLPLSPCAKAGQRRVLLLIVLRLALAI